MANLLLLDNKVLRGLPAACLLICLHGCDGPDQKVQPQASTKPPEQPAQIADRGDKTGETRVAATQPSSVASRQGVTNAADDVHPPQAATQPSAPDRITVVDGKITPVSEDDIGVRPPSDETNVEAEREQMKLQVEDHIFALIRLEMERMLIERRELLAAGRPPHDQEVRRLEDSIMRAQNYLMEAGEDVEPPDPPIVETLPKDETTEQPATAPSSS